MMKALGEWCQVGRKSRDSGCSFFSKTCPLKERQPLKKLKTEPCLRLYKTIEQTSSP